MATQVNGNGRQTPVIYVSKQKARETKLALDRADLLDKNYRMVPADANSGFEDSIAIPLKTPIDVDEYSDPWTKNVIGVGTRLCPYSTKLGNRELEPLRVHPNATIVQQAIIQTRMDIETLSNDKHSSYHTIVDDIQRLGPKVCPNKLELFGDDRTLVIPPGSFEGTAFLRLLSGEESASIRRQSDTTIFLQFWERLSAAHGSTRIVRRGTVHPNSGTRQSGHRLIFPYSGIAASTGPGSPGWICVTEQGIKQSFDMTRVMFSRGNISEKIRFGRLCQHGEVLLDMYAGIGYYTLPALIHGGVKQVVALEWNADAIQALRYNVKDNGVEARVQIFEGDCRESAKKEVLVNMFDRVSLGLLPSSEGGWETAVCALKNSTGGWLHIHANVPNAETDTWALWMCGRLLEICHDKGKPDTWIVLCTHVERVKSFAPTVSHFVADVFLGNPEQNELSNVMNGAPAGVILKSGFSASLQNKDIPSCALSPYGPLSQAWMR